ncbi:tRNA (guanine-N(7)-)-methyltransferase-like [Herpailurus yagouaroundi]|uniref:tRNA (guanine-N(7)-)-methyltransferase-like n=1 Tax=Herpailurus yagouaroundi TaxID=1608482 RepID=UPI001AD6AE9F|nr:tRNA (guanine-N(7)-)-methyltransferase-like [Puma yagouaroundi]
MGLTLNKSMFVSHMQKFPYKIILLFTSDRGKGHSVKNVFRAWPPVSKQGSWQPPTPAGLKKPLRGRWNPTGGPPCDLVRSQSLSACPVPGQSERRKEKGEGNFGRSSGSREAVARRFSPQPHRHRRRGPNSEASSCPGGEESGPTGFLRHSPSSREGAGPRGRGRAGVRRERGGPPAPGVPPRQGRPRQRPQVPHARPTRRESPPNVGLAAANGWPSDWLVEAAAALRAGTRYRPQAAAPACDPTKVPGPRGRDYSGRRPGPSTGAARPPAKRSGLGARAGDPDPLRSRPPAPTDPSTSFSACAWWVPSECSTSEGTGRFPRWGRQRGLSSNPSTALFPIRSLALSGWIPPLTEHARPSRQRHREYARHPGASWAHTAQSPAPSAAGKDHVTP